MLLHFFFDINFLSGNISTLLLGQKSYLYTITSSGTQQHSGIIDVHELLLLLFHRTQNLNTSPNYYEFRNNATLSIGLLSVIL